MTIVTSLMSYANLALIVFVVMVLAQVSKYIKLKIRNIEEQKERDKELLAEVKALRHAIEENTQ